METEGFRGASHSRFVYYYGAYSNTHRLVYEGDPPLCLCGQRMRVVGFISQAAVVAYGVLPPGDIRP